jgi:hypothetical protein
MPFPRYGLSTPPVATPSGHLFLFGGLVSESVRNDLFLLDCKTLTVAPVPPKGEVPIARVGHATALVGNVLITWGGDTKTQVDDEQDQGLYLLNMGELGLYVLAHKRSDSDLRLPCSPLVRNSLE